MKLVKSYSEYIKEGFEIKDNIIYFNPNSDEFIKTSFGKNKKLAAYEKKMPFGVIYTAYNKSTNIPSDISYKEFLDALKGKSKKYKMDIESYDKFLTRTALYLSKIVRDEEIDTILLMESSSKLVSDLSLKLNKYLPKYYEIMTFDNAIFKNPNFDEITFDKNLISKLNDKSIKSLKSAIDKMKHEKYFKIKDIYVSFRKIIKNWLKLKNNLVLKIVDKNVLLIDDILTTGSTFISASKLIEDAGAKKLIGIAIVKGV